MNFSPAISFALVFSLHEHVFNPDEGFDMLHVNAN